jgi:Transposase
VDEHEEDTQVAKKGHTEEQILRALRQAEGGTRVVDIWREHGISEATGPLLLRLLHGLGAVHLTDDRSADFLAPELLQVTPIARVVIFEVAQMMPRRGT